MYARLAPRVHEGQRCSLAPCAPGSLPTLPPFAALLRSMGISASRSGGLASPTPIDRLVEEGRINNVFSICLSDRQGTLVLGGSVRPEAQITWVPLRDQKFYALTLRDMSIGGRSFGAQCRELGPIYPLLASARVASHGRRRGQAALPQHHRGQRDDVPIPPPGGVPRIERQLHEGQVSLGALLHAQAPHAVQRRILLRHDRCRARLLCHSLPAL